MVGGRREAKQLYLQVDASVVLCIPCVQSDDSNMDVAMNPMFYKKQELMAASGCVPIASISQSYPPPSLE